MYVTTFEMKQVLGESSSDCKIGLSAGFKVATCVVLLGR